MEDITENSSISQYKEKPRAVCISASEQDKNNYLESDKKTLLKKFPRLGNKNDTAQDFFNTIIQNEFPDGITKLVFIRKHSLESNGSRLAIRPQRMPGDYLSRALPEDKTLVFRGYVWGDYFKVDGVAEYSDEPLLPYEVECRIVRYDNPAQVKASGGNFMFNLLEEMASLNEHTRNRLAEWSSYINWRREIVKARMHSVRYSRVEYRQGRLVFTLQFPSKEAFDSESRWLRKSELAAYDENKYSDEDGNFSYNENRTAKEKFEPVGELARGFKRQGRTVGDHFEIEFAYDFPNVGELEEMSDEEREDYFQSRLMSRYPKTGFLAPLVVKDLSLFKRLSTSVNFLQQDRECHSPNLAMWIFDVTCARLPSEKDRTDWEEKIGNDWLNQKVASNPNQREAILKMLAAPDLCLIQGPPGTGKTTVIAEAIYQFAKHGERVLLASQSHDAVDNALDRLADRSEIRAVRLGERERDGEEEPSKFSRDKVLSTYYACVSNSVSQNFLSRWKENRRHYDECEKDLRDWSRVSVDLDALRRELAELDERQRQCQRDYKQAQEDLEKANVSNGNHENSKRQYNAFLDMLAGGSAEFYLPLEFGECLAQNLVPALNFAREKNILLASLVTAEVIQRDPNLSLGSIVKDLKRLDELHKELSQFQANAGADSAITQIKIQQIDEEINRITEQMNAEDDDDKFRELSKKRKALREEKETLRDSSGAVNLSTENLNLLAPEIQPQIQQEDARKFLLQTITEISRQCHDALQNSARRIKELLDSYQPQDILALDERVKSYRGQIKQLDEELRRKKNEIAQKEKLGETLATKYNCAVEEIDSRIEQEMRRLDGEWENDSEIRNTWRLALEKFAQKLNDTKNATYDASSYQEIYLNSCNVVGITCTANMREMDQLFADFDVVIIDEVSKATPPELLPPLMKARKTTLVGDHRQLPPVFNEYEKSYNELLEELRAKQEETDDDEEELPLKPEDFKRYEKMVTTSLFKEYFERADERIKHSLLTQYRMHTDIQNVINRFYDGKLVNGIENENAARAHGLNVFTESGDTVFRPDSHAYWVDSSRLSGKPMLQSRYANSTSLHNIFEKHIILALLQKINDAYAALGVTGVTVGVISFYGSQVGDLRRAVKPLCKKWKSLKVSVNTVDRFQGKEKQIIITSLVCNTEHGNASRHVATFERINVAFSRAQNLLIIVGAKELYQRLRVSIPNMDTGEIRSSNIYRGIISDIYANGALIPGETLIAEDSVQTIFDEYEKEAAKS